MLTQKAIDDRMWGDFPALRKMLEDKPLPSGLHGLTSVSQNFTGFVSHLGGLVALVCEHEALIREALCGPDAVQLYRDLDQLDHHLAAASSTLSEWRLSVQRIGSTR